MSLQCCELYTCQVQVFAYYLDCFYSFLYCIQNCTRDEPGFAFTIFEKVGRAVSIRYCFLGRESHILIVYVFIMFLFCLLCLKKQQGRSPHRNKKKKGRSKDYQRKIKSSFDMPLKTELTKDKYHNTHLAYYNLLSSK